MATPETVAGRSSGNDSNGNGNGNSSRPAQLGDRFQPAEWAGKAAGPLVMAGEMWQLLVKVVGMIIRKPYGFWGEVRDQCYDMLKLVWIPASLASFGFGFGAPGLSGGAIFYAFGIPYRLGAFFQFASIREFAPFINGMVVAGVIGTAAIADIGGRRIRDELDAMEVLGVNPIRDLVVPRVVAMTIMTAVLNMLALLVGLVSGYVAAVYVFTGNGTAYTGNLYDLNNKIDLLYNSEVKSLLIGLLIGVVCCYMGLNAKGGPIGVGRAVNVGVVICFAGLWVINFLFTTITLGLNPDIQIYK